MKKTIAILFFLFAIEFIYSQTDTRVDLGVNRVASAFILRNGMNNNVSKGYGINFTISKPKKSYRLTTQYINYKTLDMEPTWKHISAYKIETNVEIVTHFENIELLLYPFVGLSYNYISGIYTGKNDPDALNRFYTLNSVVTNRWLGLTAGLGLERRIKHITVFANYRMHIVKAEDAIRMMDIGLDAGLKYGIEFKKIKRKNKTSEEIEPEQVKKEIRKRKHLFKKLKMPNQHYDIN